MAHWLFKTEPDVFGIDDLAERPTQRECWDGVRNYQARNFLRDQVQINDDVFIYHSSCKTIGIAGLGRVSRVDIVDPTQFDPHSQYYDPKSTLDNPRWITVEVEWRETFRKTLALKDIKQLPGVTHLSLLKKGHRLSIMPVQPDEYETLLIAARR